MRFKELLFTLRHLDILDEVPAKKITKTGRVIDIDLIRRVKQEPCYVCKAPPPSDPAHITVRKLKGDTPQNLLPLCRPCHQAQHWCGWKSFAAKHNIPITWEEGYPKLIID